MTLRIVLWIIGITGAVASCCAWRVEAIGRSRAFRWGGCALLAGLLLALGYQTEALARENLLPIIAACIWWLPFAVWLAFQGSGRRLTPRLVVMAFERQARETLRRACGAPADTLDLGGAHLAPTTISELALHGRQNRQSKYERESEAI